MSFKTALWVVVIIFLFLFNNLLGQALGSLGRCRMAPLVEAKARLFTDCRGMTGQLITDVLGAGVITLGSNILTPAPNLSPRLLSHELAHVSQYRLLGPLFLPVYGIANFASWVNSLMYNQDIHSGNIMEFWADSLVKP